MRKMLAIALLIAFFSWAGTASSQDAKKDKDETILEDLVKAIQKKGRDTPLVTEFLPFDGKMVNYGSPIFLPSNSVSGLTNFRWYAGGLGTRGGMAKYAAAEPNALEIVDIFPFETDTESHVIAAAASSSGTTYYKIEGESFSSGVSLYRDSGVTSTAITHAKVRDTLFIGDSSGVSAYGGVSIYPTALLVEYANGIYTDRYDWIHSGTSESVASGLTVHVGYSRPFDRFQADQNSSMSNAASGVTETMISGKMRFWLSYTCTTGGSFFQSPKIESLARELGTSWDGQNWAYPIVAGFQKTGASPFQDYSLHLQDNSEETYMDISGWVSGGTIVAGWTYRPREIHVYLPEEFKNTATSSVSPYIWNGSAWTPATGYTDNTTTGGIALAKSGVISIPKNPNWQTRRIEDIPYDVYAVLLKVSTSTGIANYVRIHKMVAVPDYDSPSSVGKYTMVGSSHNRLILANGRDRTKLLISAENQPDCFVGNDAAPEDEPIEVGGREDFLYVGPVGAETIIMKRSGNFILAGVNPGSWQVQPLYGTKPCVSAKSVQVIDINGSSLVLYAGRDGVYSIPSVEGINSDDIMAYFEPGNAKEFSYAQLKDSHSWYDPMLNEYHLIVGNTELVLSLKHKKWTTFNRAYPLTCGTYFVDSNNKRYHLGGGKSGGTVYALETGASDVGRAIISEVERPDSALGKNYDGKSELRSVALRHHLMDSQSSLAGGTAYLTSSLSPSATTYLTGVTLSGTGWQYLNLLTWANGVKGYTHRRRYAFPGRLYLLGEVVKSREAEWMRDAE